MKIATRRVVLIAGALIGLSGAAHGQVIAIVEPAPGFEYSYARYVSPNGTVIGGSLNRDAISQRATRWASVGASPEVLGVPAGTETTFAFQCSDDGQVVVGRRDFDGNNYPVMWNASGAAVTLSAPGSPSEANGVSADGSVVTGWSSTGEGRWMLGWEDGALTRQSQSSFLSGPCSPDGNTALGTRYLGGSAAAIARWTNEGGPSGSLETLTQFPAGWSSIMPPTAMTPTADVAVGRAQTQGREFHSWIWRNGEIIEMGAPEGAIDAFAASIRADGNLVVGASLFTNERRAEVWTPDGGWESFESWLAAQGMSFPGWTFGELSYISPDGLTFAGSAQTPEGVYRGFVMTIPGPGAAGILLMSFGLAARRRR